MTGATGFLAYAFFSNGARLKYEAPDRESALIRAKFWYELFILQWKGYSVEGEKVVSICVFDPCGTEQELMEKTDDSSRHRSKMDLATTWFSKNRE